MQRLLDEGNRAKLVRDKLLVNGKLYVHGDEDEDVDVSQDRTREETHRNK